MAGEGRQDRPSPVFVALSIGKVKKKKEELDGKCILFISLFFSFIHRFLVVGIPDTDGVIMQSLTHCVSSLLTAWCCISLSLYICTLPCHIYILR